MRQSLELVYRYRNLLGKCEGGQGLTFDEIDEFEGALALLRATVIADCDPARYFASAEDFPAGAVPLKGTLRSPSLRQPVLIARIGPWGSICSRAPSLAVGAALEIAIEHRSKGRSYRFASRVAWCTAEGPLGHHALGLEFLGSPLLLRYRPEGNAEKNEEIAAA